VCVCTYV